MSSYAPAPVGFASAARKGNKMTFEQRVQIGMRRYKAALARHGGKILVRSKGDMVDFGVQHVRNRGRELGDNKKKVKGGISEFRQTIIEVVERLLKKAVKYEPDDGKLILVEKPPAKKKGASPTRREHVSKAPPFRDVRTPRRYQTT